MGPTPGGGSVGSETLIDVAKRLGLPVPEMPTYWATRGAMRAMRFVEGAGPYRYEPKTAMPELPAGLVVE